MERSSKVKWNLLDKALRETTIPYILSLVTFFITFFQRTQLIENNLIIFNILIILMTIFVLWTDYKILIHMNDIKDRITGLAFLLIMFIYVLSFQVYYDMMLMNTPKTWHFLFFDGMYNLSFCSLFIVAFKFAAIYFIDFYSKIESN